MLGGGHRLPAELQRRRVGAHQRDARPHRRPVDLQVPQVLAADLRECWLVEGGVRNWGGGFVVCVRDGMELRVIGWRKIRSDAEVREQEKERETETEMRL